MIELNVPWITRLSVAGTRKNLHCLGRRRMWMKRAADIVIASSLLVLLSPLMLLFAALVKLTSPGPVIFRQERVGLNLRKSDRRLDSGSNHIAEPNLGRNRRASDRRTAGNYGRPFIMYKFRSMRFDAEAGGAQFASKGDARVTLVGRFMRRTRIDELPQLWNILRGDMSFVGPRPERPVFMKDFVEQIPGYHDRLGLKPGLTGLAQVENGYDNDFDDFRRKAAYDSVYLQNCCLRNDLKIIARTVRVIITGKGAL